MKLKVQTYHELKKHYYSPFKIKSLDKVLSKKSKVDIKNEYYIERFFKPHESWNTDTYRYVQYIMKHVKSYHVLEYLILSSPGHMFHILHDNYDAICHYKIKSTSALLFLLKYWNENYSNYPIMQIIYDIIHDCVCKCDRLRRIIEAYPQVISFFGDSLVCTHRRRINHMKLLVGKYGCNIHAYDNLMYRLLYVRKRDYPDGSEMLAYSHAIEYCAKYHGPECPQRFVPV